MAQATTWTQEQLNGFEARAIQQALSDTRSADYIPETDVVGGAAIVSLRRTSTCRACGESMKKGSEAIQFAYRWVPAFHYRITTSFLHSESCR